MRVLLELETGEFVREERMDLPGAFRLLFERILDRLDTVEGELDRLKSFTPTVT